MKVPLLFLMLAGSLLLPQYEPLAQTYQGTQSCQACHSSASIGGIQYTQWSNTLHSKIHLLPDTVGSIRPLASFTNGDSVNLGSSFGNAKVYLSRSGNNFFAKVAASGTTYKIAWTYGWGFKQRYLVKIDTSYYMLPLQFNLKKYLDNSSGTWAAYNAGNWLNANGTLKPIDNVFRTKSWDRNCVGCHVTGGKVDRVIVGADTSWHATWANSNSAANILIGCESCHGPSKGGAGKGHQMNPAKLNTKDQKLEVCGQCHNRASSQPVGGTGIGTHEFPKNETNNTYFNPADTSKPLSQFLKLANPPNATGGQGTWPDLATARQHHQQYQEFLGSKHYSNPFEEITCITCHSAHSNSPNDHNLVDSLTAHPSPTFAAVRFKVDNDDNTLCLACHATFGPFAAVKVAWVQNPTTFKDSIGAVVKSHTKHSIYDPTDALKSGGIGRCSKCHLTKTATSAIAYDIHTHTFNVVPPIRTRQYQASNIAGQKGSINSCAASCHRNSKTDDPASIIPDWGIVDASKTDWSEATDVALADTLWSAWQRWGFTGVKETKGHVPTAFNLSQNYPNPFNPSTRIMVDISNRDNVHLVVYNIIGEIVATLMDGQYNAGRYEVTWSGRDNSGFYVASGVYIYRLDVGKFSATKKMLLVK